MPTHIFDPIVPQTITAAGHRALAPDFFGFGRSDKPGDEAAYTFPFHRNFYVSGPTNCVFYRRPLQHMMFPRDAFNVRVTVLSPSNGIAFSNSSGRKWTVLSNNVYGENEIDVLRSSEDLLALNGSGFFIPDYRGGGRLFVAYQGRSLMRIEAPFQYLP